MMLIYFGEDATSVNFMVFGGDDMAEDEHFIAMGYRYPARTIVDAPMALLLRIIVITSHASSAAFFAGSLDG